MENNQDQNPREILLGAICLKPAFEAAAKEHELKQDDSMLKSNLRILWKKAVELIPIVHGQKGEKAIKFMRMMCYQEDDGFDISLLGNYWYQLDINDPHRSRIFDILTSFGLLRKSNNWSFYKTSNDENRIAGKIRLHSLTLIEVIREDIESPTLGRKLRKELLEECVQIFDFEVVNPIQFSTYSSSASQIRVFTFRD